MAANLVSPTEHVEKSSLNRSADVMFLSKSVVERRRSVHDGVWECGSLCYQVETRLHVPSVDLPII